MTLSEPVLTNPEANLNIATTVEANVVADTEAQERVRANPNWRVLGSCATKHYPDLWFESEATSHAAAKLVCQNCEIRKECLEYAMEEKINYGMWGGLTERERRRLKKERHRRSRY